MYRNGIKENVINKGRRKKENLTEGGCALGRIHAKCITKNQPKSERLSSI